jgi:hypothetical protein
MKQETKDNLYIQYDIGLVKERKLIKSLSLLKIFTGNIGSEKLILVALPQFDLNDLHIENMQKNSQFLKLKSKYLLNKKGYCYDKNNVFHLIYENSPGKILDFDDFIFDSSAKDDDLEETLKKLYLFKELLYIVKGIKAKEYCIGGFHPSIFIYNPFSSTTILKMIDYSFYNYFYKEVNGNRNIGVSFGVFNSNIDMPDDIISSIIFLIKIFIEKSNSFYELIFKFDSDFVKGREFIKNIINNSKIQPSLKKFLLKTYDFIIKNKNQNFNSKTQFKEKAQKDFEVFFNDFCKLYNELSKDIKCKNCQSKIEVDKNCFEIYCKICKPNHFCRFTELHSLQKTKEDLQNKSIKFGKLKEIFYNLPFLEEYIKGEEKNVIYEYLSKIDEMNKSILFPYIHSKKNSNKNSKFVSNYFNSNSLFMKLKNTLDNLQVFKHYLKNHINKKLEYYINFKAENLSPDSHIKLESYLKTLSLNIVKLKKINEMTKEFSNKFLEIIKLNSQYNLKLKILYSNNLKPFYNNIKKKINLVIDSYDKKFNYLPYIYSTKNVGHDFYFPITQTNRLKKLNILDGPQEEIETCDVEINFSNSDSIHEVLKYFPEKSKWVYFSNFLFFTGGVFNDQEINSCILVDLAHQEACLMKPMINKRKSHAKCIINKFFIVVVGGCNTKTCEIYYILQNKWKPLPSLNYKRKDCTLFVANKRKIYCLGGIAENNELFEEKIVIEFLDIKLNFTNDFWNLISIDDSNKRLNNLNFLSKFGVISQNNHNDKVYILGGEREQQDYMIYSDEIFLFNFHKKKLQLLQKKMSFQGCFYQSDLIERNHKFYQVSVDEQHKNPSLRPVII